MTRPARVLKSDIKRAVAALEAVGKVVVGVKFPPEGGFEVLTVNGADQQPLTDLQRWERENGRHAA